MSNPPNDEYRRTYNPEKELAFTANGVAIRPGIRVITNNLDHGTVDLSRAEWEWYPSENKYHLWFNVTLDTNWKGEPMKGSSMQSDDRVTTRFEGKPA